MKKIITLLLFPVLCLAQSPNQNYVKTVTYLQPSIPSLSDPDAEQAAVSVTYLDGLGRTMQQVVGKQSSAGKDIVTFFEYDAFGRTLKEFLPYASEQSGLGYRHDADLETFSFYDTESYGYTANPYSEKFLEASRVGKLRKQAAPGNEWMGSTSHDNDHSIRMEYGTNTVSEVRYFSAHAVWDQTNKIYTPSLSDQTDARYFQQQLYKTVTKNENWVSGDGTNNTAEEFTDKNGRVVLKRTYEAAKHDTYYVYDQFGNLTFVIPPLVDTSMSVTQSVLDGLCYQYRYDRHNRLVEKKLPGKDWEFIVYNMLDQPVLTGPVLSPSSPGEKGCLFTKYDPFGRVAYTGFYRTKSLPSRLALQTNFDNITNIAENRVKSPVSAGDVSTHYTNNVFPSSGIAVLTINYYDDYLYGTSLPMPGDVYGKTLAAEARGLQTASWERAVGAPGSAGNWTYTGYDALKFRPIWTGTHFYNGSYTMVESELDFVGKVLQTQTYHWVAGGGEQVVRDVYTYTPQQQPLRHTQQINSKPEELLYLNEYDALGQLKNKRVGGTDIAGTGPYQKIDYRYNIRGWLTDINDRHSLQDPGFRDDLFAFHINYNAVEGDVQGVAPLYNGNISETFWKSSSDNVLRSYGYRYDRLSRMLEAFYQKPGGITEYPGSYDERLQYDMNGNIESLQRNGNMDSDMGDYVSIDNLNYTYDPVKRNQLKSVADATNHPAGFKDGTNMGEDFDYDDFGNMTADRNKGISAVAYNHLNLPMKIEFGSASEKIEYIYGAGGQKLQKRVSTSGVATVTDYYGGFQYKNGVLQLMQTSEGYVAYVPSVIPLDPGTPGTPESFNYVYNYTDHLGNIRLSYGSDLSAKFLTVKILEENHYYPFGLKHANYNSDTNRYRRSEDDLVWLEPIPLDAEEKMYKYKYNGKEFQDELGLNMYDYGARFYDPAIGRWYSVDQMAEKYFDKSGYNYALNNPVIFVDPDGNEVEMCCDGLKKYLSEVWSGVSSRAQQLVSTESIASIAYPQIGMTEMLKNPQETVNALLTLSFNSSPHGIVSNAVTDPKALGETMFDGAVVAVTHKVGTSTGKTSVSGEMQNAANKASATVGEGSGAVHGTKVHSEFNKLASKVDGVTTEVSYKNGQVVPYGTKGSVRADAVVGPVASPSAIWDLKTGKAVLTPKNVAKYNEHVPGSPPVNQVKPKKN